MAKNGISIIARMLRNREVGKVVVMAGAGISTPSGIPDFRTPGSGLYDNLGKYNLPFPEAVFEINYFAENPYPFFDVAKKLYPGLYPPNITHWFVRLLQDKNFLLRFYTQNIDGLETRTGGCCFSFDESRMAQVGPTTLMTVVKTSDRFDAGTNARVFMKLNGIQNAGDTEESSSADIHLKDSFNHDINFQRNNKDLFHTPAPTLADIKSVTVWHDDTGPNASWHLEKIQVYDTSTNIIYHFPCNRWLAKDEEDGHIKLTLPCRKRTKGPPKDFPCPRPAPKEAARVEDTDTPETDQSENVTTTNIENERPLLIPKREAERMMWPVYPYPCGFGEYYGFPNGGYSDGYGRPPCTYVYNPHKMAGGMAGHSWSWSW